MEKEKFGLFISEMRKKRNMTQKMLADRLCVSDKAVSKWERGLSFPDITLLEPMAHVLGISLTELMECRTYEESSYHTEVTDRLLRESFSIQESAEQEKTKGRRHRRTFCFVLLCIACGLEIFVLYLLGYPLIDSTGTNLWLVIPMVMFFGLYFWIFVKDKLPVIYDEQKVSVYYDGFFKMSMPGVSFNNSNWPHIVNGMRIWSAAVLLIYPMMYPFTLRLEEINAFLLMPVEFAVIFSCFIPIYIGAHQAD